MAPGIEINAGISDEHAFLLEITRIFVKISAILGSNFQTINTRFFYKHTQIRGDAGLCLANFGIQAQIMLIICLILVNQMA